MVMLLSPRRLPGFGPAHASDIVDHQHAGEEVYGQVHCEITFEEDADARAVNNSRRVGHEKLLPGIPASGFQLGAQHGSSGESFIAALFQILELSDSHESHLEMT
ncbi:hypothetical protein OEG86_25320 [Hoeflea alexandrii]|uniref:hypothetical protein n=1 Tax=Hoeflea alexandrii TaxID=288436 RepID=UPI00226FEC57|nr:hypothetical protein [Hoeflea alexandrii]MCY0154982.1 hypothetical protein [Hoeflea alexandrii]